MIRNLSYRRNGSRPIRWYLSTVARPLPHLLSRYSSTSHAGQASRSPSTRLDESLDQSTSSHARFNKIGVQQLSDTVHKQLFSQTPKGPPQHLVELSKDHLRRHQLLGKNQDALPPIGFHLPTLQGSSLDEHFFKLGKACSEPHFGLASAYVQAHLPSPPRKWVRQSGWTCYYPDGNHEAVSAPNEDVLTFDTEVMWHESNFAVMACAAGKSNWYAWLSPWLLGESDSDRHLVPLGDPKQARVIVGHNIGYDRARVTEEYDLQQSNSFFMDTMSLHVAVNGMCSQQRPTWMRHKKNRDLQEEKIQEGRLLDMNTLMESRVIDEEEELWVGRSSVNSLRDVAKFHCNITIDKTQRDQFGQLDRAGVRAQIDELLDYCAADVTITHRVYQKVFPIFMKTCPHPVSFGALRHLSSEILPIDGSWAKYLENAERTYERLSTAVVQRLENLAHQAVEKKDHQLSYESDPWLQQLDWSGQAIRMVKGKRKGEPSRPAARQKKPGMPRWFKDLFATNDAQIGLTVKSRVAPLLLRLSWDGHPLVWSDVFGWTFKVPRGKASAYDNKPVVRCDRDLEKNPTLRSDQDHDYFKLPHKDGPQARCANPLAKGYLQYFENGTLSSEYHYAKEALDLNASCSYWISARDRIRSQMAVYQHDLKQDTSIRKDISAGSDSQGFILPQVIPMGTITRRAVESTWLTASNAQSNRVGSELKSMIKAPPGYCFVGADVDSEELWIASLVGDAQFQMHGGNALGFMTLEGNKSAGTDLHSTTAKILGISRNDAKVFNYGRIYGAGQKFAMTLLRQFNPSISEKETHDIATQLYRETKGTKTLRRTLSDRAFWRGGTESIVFNRLEEFAEREKPRTPVLGAGITEALMRRYINKGAFMTSRINWAIQSSGVDYLHLLIVSMDYLIKRFNLKARLAIAVHDEIRYLVEEVDKYRIALALQVSNVWTRAMFSQQMGIDDLPQSCAYFSAVDIDHVLRKEVDMDCVTPSQPSPISAGESLTMTDLLAKGPEAYLDPNIEPQNLSSMEGFTYTPRPRVIDDLINGTSNDFIQAQITGDVQELNEVVKGAQSRSKSLPRRRSNVKKHTNLHSPPQEPRLFEVPSRYNDWSKLPEGGSIKPWFQKHASKATLQDHPS